MTLSASVSAPAGSAEPARIEGVPPAAPYYPVSLDLRGRRCVVVGGGAVAAAKSRELAAAGARVRVIAADVGGEISEEAAAGRIELVARPYRPGDLADAFLVFAERGDDELLARVFAEAEERRVFCNAQDRLPYCSMIAPAVLRRGDLTVAFSTAGRAPALAVRLRDEAAQRLGPEYAALLDLCGALRPAIAAAVPDFEERRRRWYDLVDSDVLALLRAGRRAEAESRAAAILGIPSRRLEGAAPA